MAALTRGALFLLVCALSSTVAAAELSNEELQRTQVETLRRQMANELHLQAFDLIDELVYGWTQAPPFAADTAVVVADVTVPYGFGSGLEALLENHLADLVIQHGETRVRLAHCPACQAITVHSDAQGTIVSRGVDQPGALRQAGASSGAEHALFLDFEAEGAALVLRARITSLDDDLTIVRARTLSTSTSSAALLRSGDRLISAEDARHEYLDALQQRGPVVIPVRVSLIQFAPPAEGSAGIATLPILWLQTGAEMGINHARDWTGSITIGGTFVPQLYNGLMLEARVNRLLTGAATSLTQPNLYGFVGASLTTINGPVALLLRDDVPTIADVVGAATGVVSQSTTYPAITAGVDLRIGNRLGASFFAQTTPTLAGAPSIGRYLDVGLQIHSIGGEVTLCF